MASLKLLRIKGDYVSVKGSEVVFKTDKIVYVNFRKAFLHWSYPFIMTIKYGKHWEEQTMVFDGKQTTTYQTYRTSQDIDFKIKEKDDVKQYIKEWKILNVDVNNKIEDKN